MSDDALSVILEQIAELRKRVARSERMEFGTTASLLAAGFAKTSEGGEQERQYDYGYQQVEVGQRGEKHAGLFRDGGGVIHYCAGGWRYFVGGY